ncbi:MAG: sporulation transcriptional regulator SpoIIID [Enterocloster asparagiformis]|nr:sporulation transcriptional regulator SpoIIID [Enterocloster asparagiformis]
MKEYIEERAVAIANYIIDHNVTVRQTVKKFGISKFTVHTVVTKWNGCWLGWDDINTVRSKCQIRQRIPFL